MIELKMKLLQLCLLMIGVVCSTAIQTVRVELVSYINSNSVECDGRNCEAVPGGTCDNIFQFCLRAVGSATCLSTITTNDIEEDSFIFSQVVTEELGISNPIEFTNIQTEVALELFVTITDEDIIDGNDLVDQITIPISQSQTEGSLGPASQYSGICGRARLTVRVGITCIDCITCVGNFQEPDCILCDPNFIGPNCGTCAPNYFPQSRCNVFCVPRDDSTGHFTCNSVTGEKECREGFTNPSSNCVDDGETTSVNVMTAVGVSVGSFSSLLVFIIIGCVLYFCCCR